MLKLCELCVTDIRMIERLLMQCSDKIEKYASKTSPDSGYLSQMQEDGQEVTERT